MSRLSFRNLRNTLLLAAMGAAGFAPAHGQTIASWLNPVSGNWTDPTTWSSNPFHPDNGNPSGTTYHAVVDAVGAPYTVTLPILGSDNTQLELLTINSASALVEARQWLIVSQAVSVPAGTLQLTNSHLNFTGPSPILNGNVVLTGTGQSSSEATWIQTLGGQLTIGPGSVIRAVAGRSGFAGAVLTHGTLSVEHAQAEFIFDQGVQNLGEINLSDGTLNLRGNASLARLGTIQRTGGVVKLTGTFENAGNTLSLASFGGGLLLGRDFVSSNGGRINGGTISAIPGANLIVEGGTLDAVTLDTDVAVPNSVSIANSATLLSGRRITVGGSSPAAQGALIGDGTISGGGEIVFDGNPSANRLYGTLTLASDMTVRTGTGGGYIGVGTPSFGGTIVNQGTISIATPGATVTFEGKWQNQGTIVLSQGDLTFLGNYTLANMGTIIRAGGNLNVGGTLNLGGASVGLDDVTGSWNVQGTVKNGSIATSGSAELTATAAVFDGVAVNSDFSVLPSVSETSFRNGSHFSGHTARIKSGKLGAGSTGFGSAVNIVYDSPGIGSIVRVDPGAVIDAASTVRTGLGGGTLHGQGTNLGLISAETPGKTLTVGTFVNASLMRAINGSTLQLLGGANSSTVTASDAFLAAGSLWTNTGTVVAVNSPVTMSGTWNNSGVIAVNGATLRTGEDRNAVYKWTNNGTISVTDGTIVFGGAFGLNEMLSIERIGTTANILTGFGNLGNSTFTPNAQTGSWTLMGGWLSDGTITAPTGGASFALPAGGSVTFGGIKLNVDFDVPQDATLDVKNELRLNNSVVSLGPNATLNNTDPFWTVTGTGTVEFNGDGASIGRGHGGSLTISSYVRTGTSGGSIGYPGLRVINTGTISAQSPGTSILFTGTFQSARSVEARNGALIDLSGAVVINLNGGTLSGGDWQAFAGSTVSFGTGSVVNNLASVVLDGPGSYIAVDAMQRNWSSFTIRNGRNFQSLPGFVNSGILNVGTNSSFVFGAGASNSGTLSVTGGGTIDATAITNYVAGVLTGGTYSVNANSRIDLAGSITTSSAGIRLTGATASLPGIESLQTNNGTLVLNTDYVLATTGGLLNKGTISLASNSTLDVNGLLQNNGSINGQTGKLLRAAGGLTNQIGTLSGQGSINIGTSATLLVIGSYVNTGTITMNGAGIIDYLPGQSPLAAVAAQIVSGFNGGAWNGLGISRFVINDAAIRGVGYAENAQIGLSTFSGQAVDDTCVLMRRTYYGDTNLDGQVDITDLAALATAWQTAGSWISGDFDYSGFIDMTDLAALSLNWQAGVPAPPAGATGSPQAMSFAQALVSVGLGGVQVPEPAALFMLTMTALLTRRRRSAAARS